MKPEDYIYVGHMSDRHKAALRRICKKYMDGASVHGDLIPGKNWTKDMLEEVIDLANYAMFQLMEHEGADDNSGAVREG